MNPRALARRLAACTASLLLAAAPAAARTNTQGQAPAPAAEERSMLQDMFDYDNAGLIGYAIVVLSVIALALVIENFVVLRRERLAAPKLVEDLDTLFGEENWQAAAELCERDGSYLARCVAAGLMRLEHSFDTVLTAVREMETEEVVKLFQKIGWLSLVSAIAPMLGLFGTITGMFVTFSTIARHGGSVSPATLAGGIKMALITTIFGLTVAIPVGVCFFVLKQRVIRLATETNAIVEDLFERFRKA
jgi:biopolymer transport protein ExbB